MISEPGTAINVIVAQNPALDAYRGAVKFAADAELLESVSIFKTRYEEEGIDRVLSTAPAHFVCNPK